MAKTQRIPQCSRRDRYYNAISDFRSSLDDHEEVVEESFTAIRISVDNVYNSLEELKGIMSEYEEWREILVESGRLNQSHKATYDKLEEVLQSKDDVESSMVDVEYSVQEAEESLSLSEFYQTLDRAENLDIPIGFGRD